MMVLPHDCQFCDFIYDGENLRKCPSRLEIKRKKRNVHDEDVHCSKPWNTDLNTLV